MMKPTQTSRSSTSSSPKEVKDIRFLIPIEKLAQGGVDDDEDMDDDALLGELDDMD